LKVILSLVCGIGILILTGGNALAQDTVCEPLGELTPFWRNSAGIGGMGGTLSKPHVFLANGQGLELIPQYACEKSDFNYIKRNYPKEATFADHLSLVRILGGIGKEGATEPTELTLLSEIVVRGKTGELEYRWDVLDAKLKPYIESGYASNLTIVLDNTPWCLPEKGTAEGGAMGQSTPAGNVDEWFNFIKAFTARVVKNVGEDNAKHLRFRYGTEMNGMERFSGTEEEYIERYDAAAAAVQAVIPSAEFGAFNFSGAGLSQLKGGKYNVNIDVIGEHSAKRRNHYSERSQKTPFDWVAFSRYFSPGIDIEERAEGCRDIWEYMDEVCSSMPEISREIHEFGVAPWGDEVGAKMRTAEAGAYGAAMTALMNIWLWDAGIDRLWHWSMLEQVRVAGGRKESLFLGHAWFYSVMEYMRGGESYLLHPTSKSKNGTKYIGLMSVKRKEKVAYIMLVSSNPDTEEDSTESVQFEIPTQFLNFYQKKMSYTVFNKATASYDQMRRDLLEVGLLQERFVDRPDRCGNVREMAINSAGRRLIGDQIETYQTMWQQSLTLKPIKESGISGTMESDGIEITLPMTTPSIFVLKVELE
jgi:hypothetical protein